MVMNFFPRCRCQFPSTQAWADYMRVHLRTQRWVFWILITINMVAATSFLWLRAFSYAVILFLTFAGLGSACLHHSSQSSRAFELLMFLIKKQEEMRSTVHDKILTLLPDDRQRELFEWLHTKTSNPEYAQVIINTLVGFTVAHPDRNFWDHIESLRKVNAYMEGAHEPMAK